MDQQVSELLKVTIIHKNNAVQILERIETLLQKDVHHFIGAKVTRNTFNVELEVMKILETIIQVNKMLWKSSEEWLENLSAINDELPPEEVFLSQNERRLSNPFEPSPSPADEFLNSLVEKSEKIQLDPTHELEQFLKNERENVQVGMSNQESDAILSEAVVPLENLVDNSQNQDSTMQDTETETNVQRILESYDQATTSINKTVPEVNDEEFNKKLPEQPKYSALAKLEQIIQGKKTEEEKREKKVSFKLSPQITEFVPANIKKKKEKKTVQFELEDDFLNDGHVCSFLNIKSPGEFYVYRNIELYNELHLRMKDFLNTSIIVVNNFKSKSEAQSCLGDICFAFLTQKNTWFRVQVIDWMELQSEQIFVQLVDDGDIFPISYHYLRAMTDYFAKVPRLAIRCHLAELSPPISGPNWPTESTNALFALQHMKRFQVVFAHKEGISYAVDLQDEADETMLTVSEQLIELGLAVGPVSQPPSDTESHEDAEFFIKDEELVEPDNINEAVAGYDAKDEARICKFTRKNGRCFKGPRCPLEHRYFSADGTTTDKALVISQANNMIMLPPTGDQICIRPTSYVNSCRFYAHILHDVKGKFSIDDKLQKIRTALNKNNVVAKYVKFKIDPAVGELVLVKHANNWERGKYLGPSDGDDLEIFLVDFGAKIKTTLKDLRQMNDDFIDLPFQAVECLLNGYAPWQHADQRESINFFKEHMMFKVLNARVVSSTDKLIVNVLDKDGTDIGYVLKHLCLVRVQSSSETSPDCLLQK